MKEKMTCEMILVSAGEDGMGDQRACTRASVGITGDGVRVCVECARQHESEDFVVNYDVTADRPDPNRPFPVLMSYDERKRIPGAPSIVPWSLLAPHEVHAFANCGQSLEQLAARGGLGVSEIVAVIDGGGYQTACRPEAETLPRLLELLAAYEGREVEKLRRQLAAVTAALTKTREFCESLKEQEQNSAREICAADAEGFARGRVEVFKEVLTKLQARGLRTGIPENAKQAAWDDGFLEARLLVGRLASAPPGRTGAPTCDHDVPAIEADAQAEAPTRLGARFAVPREALEQINAWVGESYCAHGFVTCDECSWSNGRSLKRSGR